MIRIIGDGGHAAVVRDVLSLFTIDPKAEAAFCAVGDNAARKKEVLAAGALPWMTIVHPFAYVSKSAKIGEGTIIMAGAVVQAGAVIGRHVIVNTGASVDHHCKIGDYAHIAPGAHLCGKVQLGDGALVGVGVGIAPGAKISPWTVVKARRIDELAIPGHGRL